MYVMEAFSLCNTSCSSAGSHERTRSRLRRPPAALYNAQLRTEAVPPSRGGTERPVVSGLASQLTANTTRNWRAILPHACRVCACTPQTYGLQIGESLVPGARHPTPAPAQREAGSEPVVVRSSRTDRSQGVTPGAPSPNTEIGEDPKVASRPLPG